MEQDNFVGELFAKEATRVVDKKQIGYIPSFFTAASLPFKNLNKKDFVRKGAQGLTLTIQSPRNVPYGKYGRLLLSVLTTHAVAAKNEEQTGPFIIKYASMADLLRELQLPKQRGKDIREQVLCFAGAQFTFEQTIQEVKAGYLFKDMYEDGKYPKKDVTVETHSTGAIQFTQAVQFKDIIDPETKDTKTGEFKILLSPQFISFCSQHAIPIDYGIYKDINSPIGKDLYAWLVYRNNVIEKSVFIPRHKLVDQFMPVEEGKDPNLVNVNYARIIDLLKEIKEKYYKEVKFTIDENGAGITLHKSPTPVIKGDTRYALITNNLMDD